VELGGAVQADAEQEAVLVEEAGPVFIEPESLISRVKGCMFTFAVSQFSMLASPGTAVREQDSRDAGGMQGAIVGREPGERW